MEKIRERIDRIAYLDTLRVVSMVAVMVLHLAASGHRDSAAGSTEWAVCWLYNFGARFAVPVFVMISGALFLDPGKEITLPFLWKKYISKLLWVFFGWSLVYALAESIKEHTLFTADYFLCVAQKTVTGHYHMWYLYLIAGLYLLTPLLRRIAADPARLRPTVIGLFLLNFGLSLLTALPGVSQEVKAVVGSEIAALLTGYTGYYCLGWWLHQAQLKEKTVRRFIFLSAAIYVAAAVWGVHLGITEGISPDGMLNVRMPYTVLYSAGVFLFFKGRPRSDHRINRLVSCALGMYLVHPMANFLLRKAGIHALTIHPLLCVPLCAALVFGISYAVVSAMRKIPVARRFV